MSMGEEILPPDLEWGCEDCDYATTSQREAFAHSDAEKHSLAIRPLGAGPEVTVFPPTVKQLGDPRGGDATWTLLPPDPGVCSQCGRDHEPEQPHDQQSLHYQMSFFAEHARYPTWADAMAHCDPDVIAIWTRELRARGVDA